MDNPHLYKEAQGLNFLTDEPMWSWRCDGKIQAARFVATHNPSMYAILHPSTKSRGKWQVSYFDELGAVSDTIFSSCDKAVKELNYGYRLEEIIPLPQETFMKLSHSQLSVLQHLAACDEPLAYFKGGYWTTPSIYKSSHVEEGFHYAATSRSSRGQGQGQLVPGRHPTWYVATGTVKTLEKADLLAQTGSATNYDIRSYPQLSDRVLTEKGLALAQ